MAKIMLKTFLVLAVLGLYMLPAHADQIYICQSCTAPPGGDPNVISNTGAFNVGVAGSATLESPLLVIVAVYDGNGTPSISFGGVTAAPVGTYGLKANTGTLTSAKGGKNTAFSVLGLSAGGSDSFTNFSGADTTAGLAAPTSFKLYAFALPTELSGGPITIDESGAAAGSFIVAYDCKDGTATSTGCKKQGDVAQTVFTNTGFLKGTSGPPPTVPESSSLGLLGLGLLSLAVFTLRRPAVTLS
jgi:hypothetical protein